MLGFSHYETLVLLIFLDKNWMGLDLDHPVTPLISIEVISLLVLFVETCKWLKSGWALCCRIAMKCWALIYQQQKQTDL